MKMSEPIPMILTCPMCCARHVDAGVFATKPHHTHACQACGMTWRPAVVDTVGVQFLPGFKDEPGAQDFSPEAAARHTLARLYGSRYSVRTFEDGPNDGRILVFIDGIHRLEVGWHPGTDIDSERAAWHAVIRWIERTQET